MVQKSLNMHSPGDSKNTRTRTPDSVVWKGTKARDLVSSVRFSWDKYQRKIFVEFLKNEGLSFKNADIEPLLRNLNLDGYDNIENRYGENVSDLIEEKVRRKLKNTADEVGEDVLQRATFGPDTIDPSPREEHDDSAPRQPNTTQAPLRLLPTTIELGADSLNGDTWLPRDSAGDKARPQQQSHPLLKMPKLKENISPPNPEITIKHEHEDPSSYNFGSSRTSSVGPSLPRENFSFVNPIPPTKAGSLKTPKTSRAPSRGTDDARNTDLAQSRRLKKAIERLGAWSKRTEVALDEVEDAVHVFEADEDLEDLIGKVRHLRLGFTEVLADVEEIEDLAARILPR
ncbi:hypothetical protein F5Y06DRAFT_273177 [Hypoxylon sp. FL0890]|nr:hypothetical protein F5Y06DRAFT_273177 [Hypoxylon sp. FL0890]